MQKKKQRQQLLGQCLEQVVSTHIGPNYWQFFLLFRQWEAIVGKDIATHVIPAWLRKDTLWLYVDSAAWMQEIGFIQPDLLPKINAYLQSIVIREIRCLQQPQATTGVPEETARPERAINREKEQAFRRMTENIPDPKCGQALLKLWQTFQSKGQATKTIQKH